MFKMKRVLSVGVVSASVAVLLSACGGGEDPVDEPTGDPAQPSETASEPEASPPSDPEPASGDITPAGTVLSIGEDAVYMFHPVEFPDEGDPFLTEEGQLLRIGITGFGEGSTSDIPDDVTITGASMDEFTVVHVNWEAQIIGPSTYTMERRSLHSDLDASGYNNFMFFDDTDIPGCSQPVNLGTAFDAGEAVQGCFIVVFLTSEGMPDIVFQPWMTDLYDNPIIWRQ